MRRSFAAIDKSDFVLVELSEKGVGLGIEAGYAYARKIPVLTMAREGQDISTTLQGISAQTFTYDDTTLSSQITKLLDSAKDYRAAQG